MDDLFLCPYPWLQLSTESEESLRVCCYGRAGKVIMDKNGPISLESIEDSNQLLNIAFLRRLRAEMQRGLIPDFCLGCKKLEDSGGDSPRTLMLNIYGVLFKQSLKRTRPDGTIDNPKIRILELTLGNRCNLRCRMCSPFFSHLLQKDFDEAGIDYDRLAVDKITNSYLDFDKHKKILIQIDQLVLLSFLGGEPLIHPYHQKILEQLISDDRSLAIELRYNTNLTILNNSLKKLWAKFKNVKVSVSLEGVGELNDYIRFPSKWDSIRRNFETLIEWKKEGLPLELSVTTVFQAYSLPGIIDLLQWLLAYKAYMPVVPHFINLDFPHYLAAGVLRQKTKSDIKRKIENFVVSKEELYNTKDYGETNNKNLKILKNNLKLMMDFEFENYFMNFVVLSRKLDLLRDQTGFCQRYPELFI